MGKFTQSWLSWNAVLFPEKKHLVCALRTCTVVFFSLFFFFFHFPFILGAAFSFNLCNMDMIQWLKMKSRSAWAAFLTLPSIPPPIYAVLPWLEQDSPAPEWCFTAQLYPRSRNGHWSNAWQHLISRVIWWKSSMGSASFLLPGLLPSTVRTWKKHWDFLQWQIWKLQLNIDNEKLLVKGFMPLASTVSTRGVGNLLTFLPHYTFEFKMRNCL